MTQNPLFWFFSDIDSLHFCEISTTQTKSLKVFWKRKNMYILYAFRFIKQNICLNSKKNKTFQSHYIRFESSMGIKRPLLLYFYYIIINYFITLNLDFILIKYGKKQDFLIKKIKFLCCICFLSTIFLCFNQIISH